MLNEPVNVPPLMTVPVNGTTSLASGFAASARAIGPDPVTAINVTTSRRDSNFIAYLPLCESARMCVRRTTPGRNGVQQRCLAEIAEFLAVGGNILTGVVQRGDQRWVAIR